MGKKYLEIDEFLNEQFDASFFDKPAASIINEMQSLIDRYGDTVYLDYDYAYDAYSSGCFGT